jgi:RNA-binding protein
MIPKKLNGKALRHLRGLGHALDPVIAVGKNGITETLAKEAARALQKHELVKVRVMQEAPVDRHEAAEALAQQTGAILAQVLGRTFLLYRRNDQKPKIVLPKARPGPAA